MTYFVAYSQACKEALQELSNGKLYVKGTKNKLQGQQKTAAKVIDWIEKRVMSKLASGELKACAVNKNEAYLGFAYQEAIDALKRGHLNVLGASETAQAIDAYVRKKTIRIMGIKI